MPAPSQGEVGECQQACVVPSRESSPRNLPRTHRLPSTLRHMILELGCLAGPLRGVLGAGLGLS